MSVAAILTRGRAVAEARMTDACVITTNGAPVWNPATEVYDETPTTVYSGKCRVKMPRSMAIEPDAGETTGVVIRPEVHIPADVLDVAVGQTITVSSPVFNPTLEGVVFRVTSLFRDSQATAQRLECTEVQA
jgi:Family of unknown function (DUF6093)